MNALSRQLVNQMEGQIPDEIELRCDLISESQGDLFPAELVRIERAILSRKREYIAGRTSARKALSILGYEKFVILTGKNREPLWPPSISGSITHEKEYCATAVAQRQSIAYLGIDLATTEPLNIEVRDLICTKKEIEYTQNFPELPFDVDPHKILFSLKESFFKCYYPRLLRYFDFKDVSLQIDARNNQVQIEYENTDIFLPPYPKTKLKFFLTREYIFSIAWIVAQ
jgi:enterobactin synthetase component D